ncbi:MAG: ethylbenzene dehydrogenase-related protein [Hyphomicrobiales bacterium]
MIVIRTTNLEPFTDPASPRWARTDTTAVELVPAPLGLQPNDYIIVSWEHRSYGEVAALNVSAVHDGARIAVRLNWKKVRPDTGAGEGFADSVALAFPVRGVPLITEMGNPDAPIHALQWLARKNEIRSVSAMGIGTSLDAAQVGEAAFAGWSQGAWTVVLVRDLSGPEGTAILEPGTSTQISFAVWDGGNQERAGIKAVSADWAEFELEP